MAHERWDGKGYPDGLKGEEIPISAQVVSIVDVYDALTSERCYKKAFDHDTAIQMILDGQCGQFNPILLKCLKELRLQLSKMLDKEMDDNSYYHEVQRLSNEILSDRSLPNQNYSQSILRVMKEKVDFFKANSGMGSIDYNTSSGQLTILNGKQQILYQRNNPDFDLFKEFGVNEEDVHHIQVLLHQTSVQNKEISVQIKARVENDRQMYKLKLHTLWSPLKKDGYIGIVGYFDIVKQKNAKEAQKEDPNEKENPALAGITILAMTANAFDEDRKKALKCGMDGFLSKPIVIEELISILQKNLDQVSGVLEKPHK